MVEEIGSNKQTSLLLIGIYYDHESFIAQALTPPGGSSFARVKLDL
jgi:hypothetical protein